MNKTKTQVWQGEKKKKKKKKKKKNNVRFKPYSLIDAIKYVWGVDLRKVKLISVETGKITTILDLFDFGDYKVVKNPAQMYRDFVNIFYFGEYSEEFNRFLEDIDGNEHFFGYKEVDASALTDKELEAIYDRTQFVKEAFSKEREYYEAILDDLEQRIVNLDQEHAEDLEERLMLFNKSLAHNIKVDLKQASINFVELHKKVDEYENISDDGSNDLNVSELIEEARQKLRDNFYPIEHLENSKIVYLETGLGDSKEIAAVYVYKEIPSNIPKDKIRRVHGDFVAINPKYKGSKAAFFLGRYLAEKYDVIEGEVDLSDIRALEMHLRASGAEITGLSNYPSYPGRISFNLRGGRSKNKFFKTLEAIAEGTSRKDLPIEVTKYIEEVELEFIKDSPRLTEEKRELLNDYFKQGYVGIDAYEKDKKIVLIMSKKNKQEVCEHLEEARKLEETFNFWHNVILNNKKITLEQHGDSTYFTKGLINYRVKQDWICESTLYELINDLLDLSSLFDSPRSEDYKIIKRITSKSIPETIENNLKEKFDDMYISFLWEFSTLRKEFLKNYKKSLTPENTEILEYINKLIDKKNERFYNYEKDPNEVLRAVFYYLTNHCKKEDLDTPLNKSLLNLGSLFLEYNEIMCELKGFGFKYGDERDKEIEKRKLDCVMLNSYIYLHAAFALNCNIKLEEHLDNLDAFEDFYSENPLIKFISNPSNRKYLALLKGFEEKEIESLVDHIIDDIIVHIYDSELEKKYPKMIEELQTIQDFYINKRKELLNLDIYDEAELNEGLLEILKLDYLDKTEQELKSVIDKLNYTSKQQSFLESTLKKLYETKNKAEVVIKDKYLANENSQRFYELKEKLQNYEPLRNIERSILYMMPSLFILNVKNAKNYLYYF